MKITNITLGSDPEFFIWDKAKNKIISSIGIIPGQKGNPYRPKSLPKGYGLEIDNILGEFNIPPATTKEEYVHSFTVMRNYITKFLKRKNKNYEMLHTASAIIDDDQLTSREAKAFGCSPDFNVYSRSENEAPCGADTNLRSSGFHIHVGYDNKNTMTSLELIKYMDVYLGVLSVLLDPDTQRRKLYGKAGNFRLTPYGFEYRVLSGIFLKESLIGITYTQTMKAIKAYEKGIPLPPSELILDIINNNNATEAVKLCASPVYNIIGNNVKL